METFYTEIWLRDWETFNFMLILYVNIKIKLEHYIETLKINFLTCEYIFCPY